MSNVKAIKQVAEAVANVDSSDPHGEIQAFAWIPFVDINGIDRSRRISLGRQATTLALAQKRAVDVRNANAGTNSAINHVEVTFKIYL